MEYELSSASFTMWSNFIYPQWWYPLIIIVIICVFSLFKGSMVHTEATNPAQNLFVRLSLTCDFLFPSFTFVRVTLTTSSSSELTTWTIFRYSNFFFQNSADKNFKLFSNSNLEAGPQSVLVWRIRPWVFWSRTDTCPGRPVNSMLHL